MYGKNFKIGILGGGQLGRMLLQPAIDLDLNLKILDPDKNAPCSLWATEFVVGSLTDYDTVMSFATDCQVLTVEIENVNTEALKDLQKQGVAVYPEAHILHLIQDKCAQKQFYQKHQIPTADFVLTQNKSELSTLTHRLPAVHKLGRGGYDGRGVQMLKTQAELEKGFDAPSVLEDLVDIDKELSVIVARRPSGEMRAFPVVELVFDPRYNLVDYLLSPANITAEIEKEAKDLAFRVVEAMNFVGLLAVELFLDKNGNVLVNEVAPRPHNSGHQTIEAAQTSQFEQHLRAILDLPLGSTELLAPSAMVNIIGAEGYTGEVYYEGMDKILAIEGAHPHLYGKSITKPSRKMGHITIVDKDTASLLEKIKLAKSCLKVISR
ncbi:MAG: 5-(carboxyamino)imidazole ribonucleotide synthase [Bernardetiaceae bacterium]|nr:5-(carboxyamino)imidazole ribonucleotide synthase [Bernardetiaceae bacterium]